MNTKGSEGLNVGTFILLAVGIIVALTLLTGGISSNVGKVSQTVVWTNQVVTSAAAGSAVELTGIQALKGDITITNTTSGTAIPASNYTITNYYVSNGQLVVRLQSNAGQIGFQGKSINVSATVVEPFGYDTNAGGRVMINLVIIMAALAIAVVVIVPIVKNGVFDFN